MKVVVAAIDYEGEWPKKGGISGTTLKNSELLKLAESVRGMCNPVLCCLCDAEVANLGFSLP